MRANGAPLHVASELVSIHLVKITANYKSSCKGSQYILCESTTIKLKAGQLQPVTPCPPSFPLEWAGVVEVLPNCMPSTPLWALNPLETEMAPTALCKDREACKQARVHAHRTRDSNCQSPEEKDGILKSIDPSSVLKGTERCLIFALPCTCMCVYTNLARDVFLALKHIAPEEIWVDFSG